MTGHLRRPTDRGSVTVFTALAALALLLLTGLVVDGAGRLRAVERADQVAAEAARAAAQAANPRAATLTVDRPAALRAARAYLRAAGVDGDVRVTEPRRVDVDTTVHGRYLILGLLGNAGYAVSGHARVMLTVGVGGPG